MELRDHADMRARLPIAGDERLDAQRIAVGGIIDADAEQVLVLD